GGADVGGVDVGGEEGGEHAAEGGLTGVIEREKNFGAVGLADAELLAGGGDEGLNFEFEGVAVRRVALGGDDVDVGMAAEDGEHAFLVGLETSQAGWGHQVPPRIENRMAISITAAVKPRPTQMPILTMAEYLAGIV